MRTFVDDDGYVDYTHGELLAVEGLRKPGTLRSWTIRRAGKALRRQLPEHLAIRALVRLAAVPLLLMACATPQPTPPKPPTDPRSSPDRCFVLADALCAKVVECGGAQVQQGECLYALEKGCEDAAGITLHEMMDCLTAIKQMPCDGSLPTECNGIATSASEEQAPRQGEMRCER